ncbi:hypothetical protein [Deinococcus cellulosilyticus]|uniref:Uncharacterized protein n=1 Tax=Deinococcus cellulosilyticus (strain DSM 18568 / NBRC 106333 / KACC 11606 / 5516J-15) TaxID=1223518 RepID=A0A511N9G0_DEIC1|nr:hypothetical protein [Deinococcus cellulosilyticus]GEM49464.1 hypothetical protein DC3_50990 [Deinococcus cellulosilyticus NBRC 106333 = KACC 11606]
MLKLFLVRHHLDCVLKLLATNDSALSLQEVHRRLEHSHQLLTSLQKGPPPRPWESWSVLQFHFRKNEVDAQLQTARNHLRGWVGPDQVHLAQQTLLVVHLTLVEPTATQR